MTVATFSEIPIHPITPNTASTGTRFGAIDNRPKRHERNTRKITPNTVTNAVAKLEICDRTR